MNGSFWFDLQFLFSKSGMQCMVTRLGVNGLDDKV